MSRRLGLYWSPRSSGLKKRFAAPISGVLVGLVLVIPAVADWSFVSGEGEGSSQRTAEVEPLSRG